MKNRLSGGLKIKWRLFDGVRQFIGGKLPFFAIFTLQFIGMASTMIVPVFYKIMVDDVLIGGQHRAIWLVVIGYAAAYLLETGVLAAENYFSHKAYRLLIIKVQARLLDIITSLKLTDLKKFNPAELKTRVRDGEMLEGFFHHHVFEYIFQIIIIIVGACVLLFIDIKLALISFLTVPLSFLMTKFLGKKKLSSQEKLRSEQAKFESHIHSTLQNWKEVKVLGLEDSQAETFNEYRSRISGLFVKNQVYWYLNRTFISIKDFFVTKMNLYFIGGLMIFSDNLAVGSLLIFMVYFEKMFSAIETLHDLDMRLAGDRPAMERMCETLDMYTPEKESVRLDSFEELSFNNVTFSYGVNLPNVIDGLSFSIKKGGRVAFSGKSGAGKSTIVKLILNMYDDFSGEITLNGRPISTYTKGQLYRVFAPVMQEPYLFNLTIRENLLLSCASASVDELDKALKAAAIGDFVHSLPNGLDTIIGEKGIKLSGGQKQRLAVARLILRKAEVAIFDEAVSALDNEAEKNVHEAIAALSKDKTIIVISHRPSSLRLADKVYEL